MTTAPYSVSCKLSAAHLGLILRERTLAVRTRRTRSPSEAILSSYFRTCPNPDNWRCRILHVWSEHQRRRDRDRSNVSRTLARRTYRDRPQRKNHHFPNAGDRDCCSNFLWSSALAVRVDNRSSRHEYPGVYQTGDRVHRGDGVFSGSTRGRCLGPRWATLASGKARLLTSRDRCEWEGSTRDSCIDQAASVRFTWRLCVHRDAARTRDLEALGFHVLRFSNRDVMTSIEVVLDTVLAAASPTPPTPGPSPQGGGERVGDEPTP